MKPLKLTLQNFTCFREATEVDFTELSLYAIQGPTGSGKSSLLDAICFALYGETPRLGAKGLDALISQGAQSMAVRFEFEVGDERFEVVRSKGRKASESETRLAKYQNGKPITAVEGNKKKDIQSEIEKVVGLSFDSFTRAILLPQGQFDRFLKGNSREKQELLGRLIGLDRFTRMQKVASEKSRTARTQHDLIQHRLEMEFAEVTPERIQEQDQVLQDTLQQLQEQEQHLRVLTEALAQQEELARLHAEHNRHLKELQTLQAQKIQMEQLGRRVQAAQAVSGVLGLIRQSRTLQEKAQLARTQYAKLEQDHVRVQGTLQQAEQGFARAQEQTAQIPGFDQQILHLQEAQTQFARLKQLGGDLKLKSLQVLPWSEEAFFQARSMVELKAQLETEARQIQQEKTRLTQQKQQILKEQQDLNNRRKDLELLVPKGKEARAEYDRLRAELETSRVQHQAMHLKAHLKVGEPCPVCEQKVSRLPGTAVGNVQALEQQVKAAEKHLEEIKEAYQTEKTSLQTLASRIQQAQEYFTEREAALQELETQHQQKHQGLTTEHPQEQLQALLAGLVQTILEKSGGEDPERRIRQLQQEKQRIQQELQSSQRALGQAQTQHATLTAQLNSQKSQLAEREQEHQEASSTLKEALFALSMTEQEALQHAMTAEELQKAREAMEHWRTQMARVEVQLSDLQERMAGREYLPEQHQQQKAQHAQLETSIKALSVRMGQLQTQITHLQERLELKRNLLREAAAHQKTFNTWDALARNLQLDRFPKFLLEEVEEQLLLGAGTLLGDISDGRYALHLQDGEYVVSDHWNAGETRPIRTLSGGETFLASLSLAIALSDYLAGNKLLGALFLDEGFGTLDPQALDAVARALEKLQISGRMVGVITHVSALAARLPARMLVEKRMTGSSVRIDSEEVYS
ncbi:AAA family ATPase [Deinococcus cellulosilyticus]|uniref:Nuclease SbcCD subunit C n=1 Tax=Deinococcus cellulosilyticus (strain DSM 18568 / NBRC 106333 / KACC 11606 / 5516J-15) TaxID=1223518 RepID=A0A511N822_DEIC1|nr:SMC family ATPase [Deinococcus cellulosilyticus]GEM48983.1 nuclease SbcCD subunit C [Deinococcus cellulosilyticus NBRC 106333 = KACC 11606]